MIMKEAKASFLVGKKGQEGQGKPYWFKKEASVPILWGFMV